MRINQGNWIINIPIAHRGLHGKDIPENSILSYKNAILKGYAIEIDVRFTKDGQIVVFHDGSLERMTGEKSRVIEKTYDELLQLNLKDSNEKIPLFSQVLKTVNGKVPLLIEIKDQPERKDLVDKTLEELKAYKGEFAIQSFNPFYLIRCKKLRPDILRGQLSLKIAEGRSSLVNFVLRHFLLNIFSKPDFISFNIDDLPYKPAKRKNCRLITWTVRNYEQLNKAKKYAENFIFENIIPD